MSNNHNTHSSIVASVAIATLTLQMNSSRTGNFVEVSTLKHFSRYAECFANTTSRGIAAPLAEASCASASDWEDFSPRYYTQIGVGEYAKEFQ
ncbi:hypothetical protein CMO91_00010 [Candidatus Woesearchaeota archaeon]|nr:hypothetical protein [Candidatus Woesearchaeota archaeon]